MRRASFSFALIGCTTLLAIVSGCTTGGLGRRSVMVGLSQITELQRGFQDVVDRVSPSVVGIRALKRTSFFLPPFDENRDTENATQIVGVNGSGMILSADGTILTNEHVIRGADEILVILNKGREYAATLVAADPRTDLAILRINAKNLQPVRFAAATSVRRGQWNVAIGNPYGFGRDGHFSVSVGVVSNTRRTLPELGAEDDRYYRDMIQTTASINPGNSGGPLFNLHGEVIGIVTAMYVRNPGEEGAGFAIPLSSQTREKITRLQRGRKIDYGYFGVSVRPLTPAESRHHKLPRSVGVRVVAVDGSGPAAQAGLRDGDVIVEYAGRAVTSPDALVNMTTHTRIGRTIPILARRGSDSIELEVKIDRREPARVASIR